MSFKATLKIDSNAFNVIEIDYCIHKETDLNGMPSSVIRGGKINIRLESTGSTFFFEWICNSYEKKDGSIVFIQRDSDIVMKEIRFRNAYLVCYHEKFNFMGDYPITEHITLSALEISAGGSTLQNEWHS